jgi:flagellar biosynthesis/type III secretory pathway protein FliH
MPDNDIDSVDNWSFPDVHHDSETIETDNSFLDEFTKDDGVVVPTVEDPVIAAAREEADAKAVIENEINALKQAYADKLKIANALIERVQASVTLIDNEVVGLLQDILQKVARKILRREIAACPDLIVSMINELKTIVPAETPLVSVLISPQDYQTLCNENGEPGIKATPHESLLVGDIVIRSNTTEIRAILDDRIEKLLEVSE